MSAKSLKAKTTKRRAAKPAKPKLNAFQRRRCEVGEIGRQQDTLAKAWSRQCRLWAKAGTDSEKKRIHNVCDSVIGTMRGNLERASQLQAYSPAGACFQVILIYSEIESLEKAKSEGGDTHRHYDRLRRLCHSLREYFDEALGVDPYSLASHHYMMGGTDPRRRTEWAVRDYLTLDDDE